MISDLLSDSIRIMKDYLKMFPQVYEGYEREIYEVMIKMEELRIKLDTPPPEEKQHQWEFYINGTFCRICGTQLGSRSKCFQ